MMQPPDSRWFQLVIRARRHADDVANVTAALYHLHGLPSDRVHDPVRRWPLILDVQRRVGADYRNFVGFKDFVVDSDHELVVTVASLRWLIG